MATKYVLMMLFVGMLATASLAGAKGGETSPTRWLAAIERGEPAEVEQAVQRLRALGPAGLGALARRHEQLAGGDLALRGRLEAAMDAVAGQHLGHLSRLYWYTDLERAKQAATSSGQPILSLRLLGKLTDERSCANSRFFRAVLYPDPHVSKLLREHFVLHWSSERPVPTVTIDFGDGRRIDQTIAGNSVHYVLDTQGRPIDAVPGLYAPGPFLNELRAAFQLHQQLDRVEDEAARLQTLRAYHYQRRERTLTNWAGQLNLIRREAGEPLRDLDIVDAGRRAMTKMAIEEPVIRVMAPQLVAKLDDETTATDWQKLAERLGSPDLSDVTRTLIRREAIATGVDPDAMLDQFERTLRLDTARNQLQLHVEIHNWFADAQARLSFEGLNRRVYAELFHTPADDPWLGLLPLMSYTALEGAGTNVPGTAAP